MKKILITLLIALFFSTPLMAADFGFGVTYEDDSGRITAPIQLSEKFRLEPFLAYRNYASGTSEFTSYATGTGAFVLTERQHPSVQFYWGGRIKIDEYSNDAYSRSGFSVEPAAGFEYYFAKNVSLGAEAYFFIQNNSYSGTTTATSGTNMGTGSMILLRYYFN